MLMSFVVCVEDARFAAAKNTATTRIGLVWGVVSTYSLDMMILMTLLHFVVSELNASLHYSHVLELRPSFSPTYFADLCLVVVLIFSHLY